MWVLSRNWALKAGRSQERFFFLSSLPLFPSRLSSVNKAAQTNGTWAHYPMLREVHTYGKSFREKNFTARPINAGGKVSNLSSIQEPGCNLRGHGNF